MNLPREAAKMFWGLVALGSAEVYCKLIHSRTTRLCAVCGQSIPRSKVLAIIHPRSSEVTFIHPEPCVKEAA